MRNYNLAFVIVLSFLFACKDKSKTPAAGSDNGDTTIQSPADRGYDEDTLLLNTLTYDQVTINDLPLQLDTMTAIKMLGNTYSRDIFAIGLCYHFGDAILWDFNGNRYYIYKDSLYFHELYFDDNDKKQDFVIKLPKLTVSSKTTAEEFQKVYPISFANSAQRLPGSIIFRMGDPLQCLLRFDYKDHKLWRVAIGM